VPCLMGECLPDGPCRGGARPAESRRGPLTGRVGDLRPDVEPVGRYPWLKRTSDLNGCGRAGYYRNLMGEGNLPCRT
jgi:hypothetical protein